MVRTFLKVYMELGSYFLFLQEQIKDIIIIMSPQVPLGTCPFLVRPASQPWVGRRGRVQSPSDF